MIDDYIKDEKIASTILKNAIKKNKLGHAYILESNGYDKSFDFALSFAKYILCPYNYSNYNNCVKCTQCHNIDKNIFSELMIIEPDGLWIKKEQIEKLQHNFNNKSIEANKKIYIIKDAEKLNSSAANSILKFLEEPEPNIIAILITNNVYQMFETIVSRCQKVSLKNIYRNKSFFNKINIPESFKENLNENIEEVIKYVNYFENFGKETITYNSKILNEKFKEKEELIFLFDISIFYYKDIINYKLNKKLENFNNSQLSNNVIDKNNIANISKKIRILNKYKEDMKYNLNANLILDKLIIDLDRE